MINLPLKWIRDLFSSIASIAEGNMKPEISLPDQE